MYKRLLILLSLSFLLFLAACGGESEETPDEVAVSISPETATLTPQGSETFTATVTGSDESSVTWTASEGSLAEDGTSVTYTAPETEGEYTLTATSVADTNKSASATITVAKGDGVTISISPATADLEPGDTATFTATVEGSEDTDVSWEASGGSLEADGATATFTAPDEEGSYTVTATSDADETQSATATVTVAEDTTPAPPSDPTNNAALLSGDTIGSGAVENDTLRKEISVTLGAENPDFTLGKAYAVVARERDKESLNRLYWIMTATNTTGDLKCFVELEDVIYKGAGGTVLGEEGKVKDIVGTAGVNNIGTLSTSCLAAGETGYFVGLKSDITFDQIQSIEIPNILSSESFYTIAPLQVLPQSYTAEEAGSSQTIVVDVKNEFSEGISVDDNQVVILLAEDDSPLFWDFMKHGEDWDGTLEADTTQTLTKEFFRYEGSSSKLYVSLDVSFIQEDGPADPEDPTNPEDPEDPMDPTDPEDPEDPTDPEDPADPPSPEDPEDPTEPTDPEDPTDSEDPEDPADPEDPTEPETP